MAADAFAIPAAAQVITEIPQTSKRKKETDDLYQCQAPGCNHKDVFLKLQEHIFAEHLNRRFACPKQDCIKNYKWEVSLRAHLRKQHSNQPELSLQIKQLSIEKVNELTDPFMPNLVSTVAQYQQYQCDLCSRNFILTRPFSSP